MVSKKVNLSKLLTLILCIGMPFHSMFFAITNLNMLTLWRDLLMIVLLALIIFKRKGVIHTTIEGVLIFLTMLVCIGYALLFHSSRVSAGIWLNTLRIYIGAFAAYYVGESLADDENFKNKIFVLYVDIAVIVSIWGIFQMFVLGEKFLWNIGFGISSAVLANGFQRNVGVFSSANLMGLYLVFAIIVLLYGNIKIKFKKSILLFLFLSLILTFSTSAFWGLACCILYEGIVSGGLKRFFSFSLKFKVIKKIGYFLCTILLLLLLDQAALDGKIIGLLEERLNELTLALFASDLTRSTSASIHMTDLISAVDTVKKNFGGIGFSDSSFMLLGRVDKVFLTNSVESSLFTILFDFGVVVGIIYLLPFIYPIIIGTKNRKSKPVIADKMMIALVVLYVFLPLVSSIELRYFAFLFLGLETGKCQIKKN